MYLPTDNDYDILEAMTKYGGSFVQALAEAFHRADASNFEKLMRAFPEYWQQYEELAKKDRSHA